MSEQDTPAEQVAAPSLRELGERAAAFGLVAQRFKKLADDASAELTGAMLAKHKAEGVRSVDVATGPESERTTAVGYTVRMPSAGPKITDNAAFLAHCEEHYSHQVDWVPVVRPAFVTALTKSAVRVDEGGTAVVDPATGLVVAGMEWVPAAEPTGIQPSWKPGGRERLLSELLGGENVRAALTAALGAPSGTGVNGGAPW